MRGRHFRPPAFRTEGAAVRILLRKIWRAGVKKLKEHCFALLVEFRRAETRSGAIRAFSFQKGSSFVQ